MKGSIQCKKAAKTDPEGPTARNTGTGSIPQAVKSWIESEAPSQLGIFERAYRTRSRVAAINAMCLECMGLSRQEVRDCTDRSCPLWNVRPYK